MCARGKRVYPRCAMVRAGCMSRSAGRASAASGVCPCVVAWPCPCTAWTIVEGQRAHTTMCVQGAGGAGADSAGFFGVRYFCAVSCGE